MSIPLLPVTAESCLRAVTLLASEALHNTQWNPSRVHNSTNDTYRDVYEDNGNVRVRIVRVGARSLLDALQALDETGSGGSVGGGGDAAVGTAGMTGESSLTSYRTHPIHVQDAIRRGDDMCCICYDRYAEETEYQDVVELPCAHTFHAACVRDWHRHSPACPLCRRVASSE